jgi:hypothetical protein
VTGRTPACEDAAAISARLRQIQRDRMAAIAGCCCPQRDTTGEIVHTPVCPLRQGPSQMAPTLEAMQRARLRIYRTRGMPVPERADEIIAEGIAAKYARHRVLS